ncbi:MAG: transposase [Candidatus Acidiferrales bacterium]
MDCGIRPADRANRQTDYKQVAVLKQVKGIGALIALTFVLTLNDPHLFRRSRDVRAFCAVAFRTQEIYLDSHRLSHRRNNGDDLTNYKALTGAGQRV